MELPDLAIAILAIAVNTATCERLFSGVGLIHTTIRNKMTSAKALLIHWVRKRTRRNNELYRQKASIKRVIDPTERPICPLRQDDQMDCDMAGETRDQRHDSEREPSGSLMTEFVDEIMAHREFTQAFKASQSPINHAQACAGSATSTSMATKNNSFEEEESSTKGEREELCPREKATERLERTEGALGRLILCRRSKHHLHMPTVMSTIPYLSIIFNRKSV
jgi:hypothetical protein